MKKVLAIVLSLSMVLGSFSMAFAATSPSTAFDDVDGKDCAEAVKVLTDLKVVTGYDDGTYKPENIVTRAEMAVLVVNALGLSDYVTAGAKSTFTDMANYGWAEGYISYAQSLGVISGYGDGTFQPGKTVSYDEAATMLVAALGYTPASLQGTWPANYVTKAKSLGVLDNVKAGAEGANRGDVAVMLYQSLDQKIGTVDNENRWVANSGKVITDQKDSEKKTDTGDRMIFRLGADPEDTEADSVVTGDEDSDLNLRPYVGASATKYFKDNKIIAVTDVNSTFIDGDFEDNYATFAGNDDVDYTVKNGNSDSVYVFMNGKFVQTSTLGGIETISNVTSDSAVIAAKVSGKNISDVYSVMAWKENSAAKVDSGDIDAIKEDKELLGYSFATLKDKSIDENSFELRGVDSLSKIAADNVVAVFTEKQEDKKDIRRIEVGTEVVKGEVTKIKGTGADTKYTIGGKEYKASKLEGSDWAGSSTVLFEVGDDVKAYLDYDGKIYTADVNEESGKYALVTDYARLSGSYGGKYQIELLTADGKTTTFDIKDNDLVTKGGVGNDFTKIASVGTLVKYDTNKDGKIDELTNGGLTTPLNGKLSSSRDILDKKTVSTGVVVYAGEKNAADPDWDVYSINDIETGEVLTGQYITNNAGDKIVAIVLYDTNNVGAGNHFGVVSEWGKTTNDGDKVYSIAGMMGGKAFDMLTDDDDSAYEVSATGFYRFKVTGDEITAIKSVGFVDDEDSITGDKVMAFGTASTGALASGFVDFGKTIDKIANVDEIGTTTKAIGLKNGLFAFVVQSVEGNRIELGGDKVNIGSATVYSPSFDKDDDFEAWTTGRVTKNGLIVLIQTDKDSSTYDTAIFVKKGDVDKFINMFK